MTSTEALFDLSRDVVVITGGLGQLGRSYARAFLDKGARVALLDVNVAPEILEKHFGPSVDPKKLIALQCNILDKSAIRACLAEIMKQFGSPTVLVNNAAIDSPPNAPIEENGPFENYPEESFAKVLDVNVKGVFLVSQVIGGKMAESGGGSIINISSIYGVVSPDQNIYEYRRKRGEIFYKPVSYSVSKSALLNLTRYLAVYWAKKKVRVNTLTLAGVFNNQDAQFLEAYCGRIPVGRMASETEYNGAVIFLASSASAYMTGSNLTIDGGWTAI
jgi:NAD(P)-dependent dehydrogenase (short-subunit alcohol dehydrogenase family)